MRVTASVTSSGTIQLPLDERLRAWLVKRKGQRLEVELRDEAAIRSDRQNRYFHGPLIDHVAALWWEDGIRYCSPEGVEFPMPREAIKDALVTAFGGGVIETPLGKARRRSTADMTVAEMSALFERINEYCVHKVGARGPIPDPEDRYVRG